MVHLNVRSLLPKIDAIRHDFIVPNMDLICCSETWLSENITGSMVAVENYRLIINDHTYKRDGGTCIYINNRLDYIIPQDSWHDCDIEIQSVLLLGNNENKHCKKICVVVVYRPPSGKARRACDALKSLNRKPK